MLRFVKALGEDHGALRSCAHNGHVDETISFHLAATITGETYARYTRVVKMVVKQVGVHFLFLKLSNDASSD